jgi:hypothetical protein
MLRVSSSSRINRSNPSSEGLLSFTQRRINMSPFKRKVALSVAGLTLIGTAVGVSVGVAEASIPDSGGTIHGCYNNYLGNLRVVDSSTSSCNADETSLNWNQSPAASVYTVTDSSGSVGNNVISCNSSSDKVLGFGFNEIVPSAVMYPSSSYQYTYYDQYGGGTFYITCMSAS